MENTKQSSPTPKGKETPPPTPAEVKAKDEEIAQLKADNKKLRETPAPTPTPPTPKVTTAVLLALPPEKREELAEKTGKEFDQIFREVQSAEMAETSSRLDSREAVADVLDSLVLDQPKLANIKSEIKAFINKQPLHLRDSVDSVKALVEDAVFYAKGKTGWSDAPTTPQGGRQLGNDNPGGEFEGDDDDSGGGMKPGDVVELADGGKIRISDLNSKEHMKKIKHPHYENGISIPLAVEEKPRF